MERSNSIDEGETMTEHRTQKAWRLCAKWQAACLKLGWKKSDLDDLEEIFWRYRDNHGRLKKPVSN
jgi:hypothetical protein